MKETGAKVETEYLGFKYGDVPDDLRKAWIKLNFDEKGKVYNFRNFLIPKFGDVYSFLYFSNSGSRTIFWCKNFLDF